MRKTSKNTRVDLNEYQKSESKFHRVSFSFHFFYRLNVGGSMNLHMHLIKGSVNTSQYDGQSVSMSQNVTALPPIN